MMTTLVPRVPFSIIFSITHISLDAGLASALHPEGKLTRSAMQIFRFHGSKPVNTMVDEDIQFPLTMVLARSSATLNNDPQVAEGIFVRGDACYGTSCTFIDLVWPCTWWHGAVGAWLRP
jgi:hypothetical protein